MKFSVFDWIIFILVIVGAVNWGLVGFFEFNAVEELFGDGAFTRVVYALVGIAGIIMIYSLSKPYSTAHRID